MYKYGKWMWLCHVKNVHVQMNKKNKFQIFESNFSILISVYVWKVSRKILNDVCTRDAQNEWKK